MSETEDNRIRHKDSIPPRKEYVQSYVLSYPSKHAIISIVPKNIALAMLNSSWYREYPNGALSIDRKTGEVIDLHNKLAFRITPSAELCWQVWSKYDTISYPEMKQIPLHERRIHTRDLEEYEESLNPDSPSLWLYRADSNWIITTPTVDQHYPWQTQDKR